MKLSSGFWQTCKEAPKDAEIPSHALMIRAGLIHKSAAGLYSLLPFGLKVIQKIKRIVREEHDRVGCHEITAPIVTPGELWQETGRWDKMQGLMLKAVDRNQKDVCLSPTNEESFVDIFRKTINSYKQLPVTLYQINTKYRDEIRPRYGLMRCREFIMKDAYSFHETQESLNETYEKLFKVYSNIFRRVGLEFMPVEADGGAIAGGNSKTHEFQVLAKSGEDKILYAKIANYAANVEKAKGFRVIETRSKETTLTKIHTPAAVTMVQVCKLLSIPLEQSLKALVYKSETNKTEEFLLFIIYGDDTLNETKALSYLNCHRLEAASDKEMAKLGLVKGYIGPANLKDIRVIFDESVEPESYYTVGANEKDHHYTGFTPSSLTSLERVDLREVREGDLEPGGSGEKLVEVKGVEVGHIFQLGDLYTKAMKAVVSDRNGKPFNPLMGTYGIGITRTMAAAIEQRHDEKGIVWPKSIAPFQVYFVVIAKSDEVKKIAEQIYQTLEQAGIEVLLDDRDVGPGFKFKDADLLGLPLRLTLGERDYLKTGKLELKARNADECLQLEINEIIKSVHEKLEHLS